MSVKRNTLLNLFGYAIPAALSLVTVPLYLQGIGAARYGAWLLIWTLLMYFSVFEMGLSKAAANRIATKRSQAENLAPAVFWTAQWLSLIFTILGASCLYLAGSLLLAEVFRMDREFLAELEESLPWIAAWIPVSAVGNVSVGALEGRERFGITNALQVLGFAVFQLSPIAAVMAWGPSLHSMMKAAVLSRAVFALAQWIAACSHLRVRRPGGFDRAEGRFLLGYGAWSAAIGLINPAIEGLDRILIGFVLGAKPVALYSVPYGLTDKVRVIPDALQRSLLPRFAGHEDSSSAAGQASAAARLLMMAMTLVVAPALFILGPFLQFWVGDEFAVQATPIGQVLLLGMWASSPAMVARALLQGRGRPDRVAKLHLAQAVPYLGLLWVLLDHWGLIGAAIAWVLRGVADTILTLWISGLLRWNLLPSVPLMALLGAAFFIAHLNNPPLIPAIGYGAAFDICVLLLALLITPDLFPVFSRKRVTFSRDSSRPESVE